MRPFLSLWSTSKTAPACILTTHQLIPGAREYSANWQFVVGDFAVGGLNAGIGSSNDYESRGVGVQRKFSESHLLEKPATFIPEPSYQTFLPTKQPQPNLVQPFKSFSQQAPSRAPAVSFFFQPSMQSALPPIVFGKAKWDQYFGDVGIEPPLPADIHQILNAPCPFWPGKRVEETHLLTLIPRTVNGRPFTLNSLGELIQKPQGGGKATKYDSFLGEIKKEYGNIAPIASYWVLMTKDIIPKSGGKTFDAQKQLLATYNQRSRLPYEVPRLLESATSILMEHVQSGTRLYDDSFYCFTRSQELASDPNKLLVVGGFDANGLSLCHAAFMITGTSASAWLVA